MIFGAHVIVYSKDAAADRAFFRDVLGFSAVDAGHDWLIFALPPAEMAIHPAEEYVGQELYLMSDDLNFDIAALEQKHVRCSELEELRWGSVTRITLPGGSQVSLYQPKHPSPLAPASNR
ncbi:MAG TPA: extradiol dioxygenase [Candidatus Dormibacteraeota bacterium]|nr:extradiol dioxygenase [Candidatus Dormibacteraeota bacterium]